MNPRPMPKEPPVIVAREPGLIVAIVWEVVGVLAVLKWLV